MIENGNGDDEWNRAFMVIADDLQELLFFVSGELFLEVSRDMREDIGMLFQCCRKAETLHHGLYIDVPQLPRMALGAGVVGLQDDPELES